RPGPRLRPAVLPGVGPGPGGGPQGGDEDQGDLVGRAVRHPGRGAGLKRRAAPPRGRDRPRTAGTPRRETRTAPPRRRPWSPHPVPLILSIACRACSAGGRDGSEDTDALAAGTGGGCSPAGFACAAGFTERSRWLTASSSVTGRCVWEASRPAS